MAARHRRIRLARGRPRRAGAVVALLLAALLPGCAMEPEDELSGPFGPGAGGPAVPQGAVRTVALTTAGGAPMGSLQYDDGYFAAAPVPETLVVLDSGAPDAVTLAVTRITGRPDTPCRFSAALLARDEGYTILASGDRTNANGLEFHQVNLVRGSTYQRFYCTGLRSDAGIQISGRSLGGNRLGTLQVHFVLNSVAR